MSGHRQTFLAASAARALLHYGSLEDNARRSLTAAEIDWNDELLTSSLRCLSKIHFRLNGVLREVGAGAQAPGNEEQADSRVSRRRPRLASSCRLPYCTCRRCCQEGLIQAGPVGRRLPLASYPGCNRHGWKACGTQEGFRDWPPLLIEDPLQTVSRCSASCTAARWVGGY